MLTFSVCFAHRSWGCPVVWVQSTVDIKYNTKLEGGLKNHLVQLFLAKESIIYTRCPSTLSSWILKVSNVGDSATSLMRLFQWLVALIVKNFPLVSSRNLPRSNLEKGRFHLFRSHPLNTGTSLIITCDTRTCWDETVIWSFMLHLVVLTLFVQCCPVWFQACVEGRED